MAEFSVVSNGIFCELGEGPWWEGESNQLLWVDILKSSLHQLSVSDGSVKSWRFPEHISWVIPRSHGKSFIAGLRTGFADITLEPFTIRRFALIPDHMRHADLRLNDAKADSRGRIYAGSIDMSSARNGLLYLLDVDRSFRVVDSGYGITNGPTFSPRSDILYHADSKKGVVYQFRVHQDGSLGEKREFVHFSQDWGVPDGMTTDTDGCVWIAHWGGSRVSRFRPDGKLDLSLQLPASQITSCVFAGTDLREMYVTSAALGKLDEKLAGAVFKIEPGYQGLAAQKFAG